METVRVVEPEPFAGRVRVSGLRETRGPLGYTVAVNETEPEKPLRLVTVTLAEPLEPGAIAMAARLDAALKSGVVLALDCTTMLPIIIARCIEQKYV